MNKTRLIRGFLLCDRYYGAKPFSLMERFRWLITSSVYGNIKIKTEIKIVSHNKIISCAPRTCVTSGFDSRWIGVSSSSNPLAGYGFDLSEIRKC